MSMSVECPLRNKEHSTKACRRGHRSAYNNYHILQISNLESRIIYVHFSSYRCTNTKTRIAGNQTTGKQKRKPTDCRPSVPEQQKFITQERRLIPKADSLLTHTWWIKELRITTRIFNELSARSRMVNKSRNLPPGSVIMDVLNIRSWGLKTVDNGLFHGIMINMSLHSSIGCNRSVWTLQSTPVNLAMDIRKNLQRTAKGSRPPLPSISSRIRASVLRGLNWPYSSHYETTSHSGL